MSSVLSKPDYESLSEKDKLAVLHKLALISGYEKPVPTIDEFIDDPYYLGSILGEHLYPIWREAARKVFPNPYYSPYEEIILGGGIGLGKSTFSLLVTLYDLCKLLSLKDPHKHYNLIESTIISYSLVNATKDLAGTVLYNQAIEWIESSSFFKPYLHTGRGYPTLFKRNINITLGSKGRHMLGQATIGAIFSELNFMSADNASDAVDTVAVRRKSRFAGKGKPINGHLIIDSSSNDAISYVNKRKEDKIASGNYDFIEFSFAHWEAKWHQGGYSGKFFKVYAGDSSSDPFIIEDESNLKSMDLDKNRIIEVPVEHREDFEINIYKAIRDLAGISTFSSNAFISSSKLVSEVFEKKNPVSMSTIVLDFYDRDQKLLNFIDIPSMIEIKNPRFIHIDLGLSNDSTGISCVYIKEFRNIDRIDKQKGNKTLYKVPVFEQEWLMEIRSKVGHEVPIYKIKDFILSIQAMGYPIAGVSTDGFQSSNLRQDLMLSGINTELISVDRTKDPYYHLRNVILEKRLIGIKNPKLIQEILTLQELPKKFDHTAEGSKDLLDSLCGAVWLAHKKEDSTTVPITSDEYIGALEKRNKQNEIKALFRRGKVIKQ